MERRTNDAISYGYCMYTGDKCIKCNKCEHIPQYTIINQIPNQSGNWSSKLIIVLLIIFIILLSIILIPHLITSNIGNLMQATPDNYHTPTPYVSNYEPQNSYYSSGGQSYNIYPSTSTLRENTTGESYNSMR